MLSDNGVPLFFVLLSHKKLNQKQMKLSGGSISMKNQESDYKKKNKCNQGSCLLRSDFLMITKITKILINSNYYFFPSESINKKKSNLCNL